MPTSQQIQIFKNGSRTYFYSSWFFPQQIKQDVFVLYAFVRTADDFVDQTPPKAAAFRKFKDQYYQALRPQSHPSGNLVIDDFVALQQKHGFHQSWVDAFLAAMEGDLAVKKYATLKDLEKYMYGSAEVIGLMMAKLMRLSPQAMRSAQLLGKAMQYANFIRDIAEDETLGRTYLPQEVINPFGFKSFKKGIVKSNRDAFYVLLRQETQRYLKWSQEAKNGFHYLPKRYRIPIATATAMYDWTMDQVAAQPEKVLTQKIKPSVPRICLNLLYNSLV